MLVSEKKTGEESEGEQAEELESSTEGVKKRGLRFSIGKSLKRLSRRMSSADVSSPPITGIDQQIQGPGDGGAKPPVLAKGTSASSSTPVLPLRPGPAARLPTAGASRATEWTVDDVCDWLDSVQASDLRKYKDSFRQQVRAAFHVECLML